jgi:ArsR family transcriptional regulator, lead/cadmium/zinc/bismuth-responsive transcriptional repressor
MARANRINARPAEFVDPRQARQAASALPHDGVINALAETFRALADPTRIRIIAALSQRELCVLDLARILKLTASAISHQLRLLRGQRLVKYRKEGKAAFYALDDIHISHLLAEGVRHVGAS